MEQRSAALEAVFEPVCPPTTFEETVGRLGKAIRVGLLPPGTRLPPERELAKQLGISRSTLRQAIVTLVQSGYLLSLRGRGGGTFVADEPPLGVPAAKRPSTRRMREILDYRVAVETGAAMLAADRAGPRDIARLKECVDQMSDVQRFESYRRSDMRFHITLAEAGGSRRLVTAMSEVQADIGELIALIPHPEEVLTRSNAQHAQLVKALEAQDGARAVKLARRHVAGTEHILAALMPPAKPRR